MKSPLLILFFLLFINIARAVESDTTRTELLTLLKQRAELFKDYSESLTKKSGFFGNRTKNDMNESQQKLLAIINEDNKVMNTLKRMLDYKTFEKQSLSYDANSFEDRIKNISILNDALNTQIGTYEEDCKSYRATIRRHQIYFFILIASLFMTVGILIRMIYRK